MKRLTLLALVLLASLCAPRAARAADDAPVEVPFSFEKGYVVVQVKVKGKLPAEVLLSTGSEHSTVDFKMLDKYELQAAYTAVGVVTGRNDQTVTFSPVPDIRLGDKSWSLNMRLGSTHTVSAKLGREIFGILGADFFRGRVAQFDFGAKVFRLLPKSPEAAPANAGGRAVLPMKFYKDNVTMPLVENVMLNGQKVKTLLDTGTVTTLALAPNTSKQLGMPTPPEKADPVADKVKTLRLDAHEITDVPVILFAKGAGFDFSGSGAVAGTVLMQNFVATFDYRKKVVILERI
ncbi:MAG TPA: hypothetical protein VEQ42_12190 [Pyrinomonadaceae bacterium]|nr:hypothetical protein [Pyrinomonadaceae bacterium]